MSDEQILQSAESFKEEEQDQCGQEEQGAPVSFDDDMDPPGELTNPPQTPGYK
jgi:hypothetical protein